MRDGFLLVAGLALLTFAADRFVDGSVAVATRLRVPIVIVGALVIGFGTSAPELLVSALASLDGKQDIAVGNIVGSNTANLLLVIGSAGLLATLPVDVRIWKREVRLMFGSVVLLAVVAWDRRILGAEAILLLVAAVAAIGLMAFWARSGRDAGDLEAEVAAEYHVDVALPKAWAITIAGLVGTLAGAQLLVDGAAGLATTLGVPEAVVGLTIVAIGTSLPELVTAVAAARKGEDDLIIGNIVGSNIFNSLPVAGVAGLLDTTPLDAQLPQAIGVMLLACVAFGVFARRAFHISRAEGGVLLAGFAAATAIAF